MCVAPNLCASSGCGFALCLVNLRCCARPQETQRVEQALPLVTHQPIGRGGSLEDSVAAFLIGGRDRLQTNCCWAAFSHGADRVAANGNYSYYLASTGWFDYDWEWHPKEFDGEIGTPLGPATFEGGSVEGGRSYTRAFSKCTVTSVCPAAGATEKTCAGKVTFK